MSHSTLALIQGTNINAMASLIGWSNASTGVSPLGRRYAHRFINLQEKPSGTLTFEDNEILQLEQMLDHVQKHFELLRAKSAEAEIPEVFDLQPLTEARIAVKVGKVEAAQFYFAGDGQLNGADIEN